MKTVVPGVLRAEMADLPDRGGKGRLFIYPARSNGRGPLYVDHSFNVLRSVFTGEVEKGRGNTGSRRKIEDNYYYLLGMGKVAVNLAYVLMIDHHTEFPDSDRHYGKKRMSVSDLGEKISELVLPNETVSASSECYGSLCREDEREIFASLNSYKHDLHQVGKSILKSRRSDGLMDNLGKMVLAHRISTAFRDSLVAINMGLVYSRTENFPWKVDVAGAGLMALFRSVNSFNPFRGKKFSTYACNAIERSFIREGERDGRADAISLESCDEPDFISPDMDHQFDLEKGRELVWDFLDSDGDNLAGLKDNERGVLRLRFGFDSVEGPLSEKSYYGCAMTHEEVGKEMGYSRTGIRHLESAGFKKIRSAFEERD